MLDNFKKYFTYNKKERTGTLILMILIFMLIMVNTLLPYINETKKIDYSHFEKEIEKIEMNSKRKKSNVKNFDSDKQIDKFSEKNQLNTPKRIHNEKKLRNKINVNVADSAELLNLSGIGPVFASRIVKYRNLLGGYIKTEQLLEVFGMDSLRYNKILPHIHVSEVSLKKINLNKATFGEILRHPYVSYETVKEIVNYRKSNGGFNNVNELLNIPGVDTNSYNKLFPYFGI